MAVEKDMIEMAIGALLHDVGKICERTGRKLNTDLRHLYGNYPHPQHTSWFFEQVPNIWTGLNESNIANLASYHHNSGTAQRRIITQADIYSAASDRREDEKAEEIQQGKSRRPLLSIFKDIQLGEKTPVSDMWAYSAEICELGTPAIFPQIHTAGDELANENKYHEIESNLLEDFKNSTNIPVNLLMDCILTICRRYMTLITSSASRVEIPDIPLFDHCYTTAAIACAMYAWHKQNNSMDIDAVCNNGTQKFMLISADLSGIQDFILDLPNQAQAGTAKILRARSFYISMLTRAASIIMLQELGLPNCNCLMDAGGRFVILAQNTPQAKTTVNSLKKHFDQWLLNKLHGKISLNISEPLELCGEDFKSGNYRQITQKLAFLTDIAKKRKFASVLQNHGKWELSALMPQIDTADDLNKQFKDLGGYIPSAKFILLKNDDSSDGIMKLFDRLSLLNLEKQPPYLDDSVICAMAVNPQSYTPGFSSLHITCHAPRIKQIPECSPDEQEDYKIDQVMPFDLIAKQSEGAELLAVLKADVDRLGMIFAEGIKKPENDKDKDKYSISRVAALSRMINGFFSEYLEHLLETEYKDIYTEYAGGDDLLLVGPWNKIFLLASYINKKFQEYTCRNRDITISASIALTQPGKPIGNAVRQADILLELAKSSGRNKIAVFGLALEWPAFDKALNDAEELFKFTEAKEISQGLLYRLLKYYKMYERTLKQECSIQDLLWKSHLRYDLARNIDEKDWDVRNKLDEITSLDDMKRLKVSSTFTLYRIRNRKS